MSILYAYIVAYTQIYFNRFAYINWKKAIGGAG